MICEAKTEQEMRDCKGAHPKEITELAEYINSLVEREHDYGTCVYALSMAAEAAFNFVAGKLGVTGFQASCADLNFLSRTRGMKNGFMILNYDNLLYPQYCDTEHFPGWEELIHKNSKWLREEAQKRLDEERAAHPNVITHWKMLAALPKESGGE